MAQLIADPSWGYLLPVLLIDGLAVVAVAGWFLTRATHAAERRNVDAWASAHALVLTGRNRPMVAYYLLYGQCLRTIGGVGGLALGPLVGAALGVTVNAGFLWWVWIIGGCLLGAMWAELFLTRPMGRSRVAALSPRLLPDYLPGRLRWGLRAGGLIALGAGMAAWSVASPSGLARFRGEISSGVALGLGIAGAVLVLLVEALQRHVVGRPQPVVAPDLMAADDAIRAASVHTLAGTGLAIELCVAAVAFTRLVEAHPRLPLGLGAGPQVVFVAALGAWRYYSHRAWRVRRPVTFPSSATDRANP